MKPTDICQEYSFRYSQCSGMDPRLEAIVTSHHASNFTSDYNKEQKMFKTNILLQINIVTQQSLGHYAQYGHFSFLNSGLSVSDLGISWNIDFYFIFRLSLNLILRSKFPRQQKSGHIPVDPRFLFNDQRLSIERPLSKKFLKLLETSKII